jgi:hypothetical protein
MKFRDGHVCSFQSFTDFTNETYLGVPMHLSSQTPIEATAVTSHSSDSEMEEENHRVYHDLQPKISHSLDSEDSQDISMYEQDESHIRKDVFLDTFNLLGKTATPFFQSPLIHCVLQITINSRNGQIFHPQSGHRVT